MSTRNPPVRHRKLRFLLTWGVLVWGCLTASLYTWFMCAMHMNVNFGEILLNYTLFPLAGLLWGAIMWNIVHARTPREKD